MNPTSNIEQLPCLAFGNKNANITSDLTVFQEKMALVCRAMNDCSPVGDKKDFATKASILDVNGFRLVAMANSPTRINVGVNNDISLMIPISGWNVTDIAKSKLRWTSRGEALIACGEPRDGESGHRSVLLLDIVPDRLRNLARTMLGEAETPELYLSDSRRLPLQVGAFDFDSVFRQLSLLIDSFDQSPEVLFHLGIDDSFYRAVVMMLRPDLFVTPNISSTDSQISRREVALVCDYISGNLSERLTLSDMEKVSGLSARSLQYYFRSRFGCSPMQWIREERLLAARKQLLSIRDGQTIVDIALSCGFVNQGAFSSVYRRRFGELPSTTAGKRPVRHQAPE